MSIDNAGNLALPPKDIPELLLLDYHHCNFDTKAPVITSALQPVSGWFMSRDRVYPKFRVNGFFIDEVQFFDRPDVLEIAKGCFCTGWALYLDAARLMSPDQHAIVVEVLVEDRLIARSLHRCRLPRDIVGPKDLVAFIHIPKSGGTSLRRSIEANHETFRLLTSYDDYGHFPTSQLSGLSKAACFEIDGIYGHFSHGFHTNISRRTRYISVVRNPFDTLLSFYFFARYEQKQAKIISCADIYEALERRLDPCLDNIITRMFSGVSEETTVCQDVYERAVKNIDQDFEFIGLLEDLPRTVSRIGIYLGINLEIFRENVTRTSQEYEMLDIQQLRTFSLPYIRYDLALYEYILRRFWGHGNYSDIKVPDTI